MAALKLDWFCIQLGINDTHATPPQKGFGIIHTDGYRLVSGRIETSRGVRMRVGGEGVPIYQVA